MINHGYPWLTMQLKTFAAQNFRNSKRLHLKTFATQNICNSQLLQLKSKTALGQEIDHKGTLTSRSIETITLR